MKWAFLSVAMILGLNAAPAKARAFALPEEHLALPKSLSFIGHTLEIQNPTWFANFFGVLERECTDLLTADDMAGPVEIITAGPKTLVLQYNGQISRLIMGAETTYVPVHIEGGKRVHPYFLVETPGWVKFQVMIHKSEGVKTLSVFLLKGRPGAQTLMPIFTAEGV